MPNTRKVLYRRHAFTIVELLVVIGIIAILMGILFPVIKHVRYAAYTADTQNEIDQIASACQQYYSTYQAYPGPISNDVIEKVTSASVPAATGLPSYTFTGINMELYASTSTSSPPTYQTSPPSPWPTKWFVTGSENLVLGLMGGLRIDPANGNSAFAPGEVGLGPMSLNLQNPKRDQAYFTAGSNYLMWCQIPNGGGSIFQTTAYQAFDSTGKPTAFAPFTDAANNQASGSPIPIFVDRFPGALPILYLRARTGAPGVVSDGSITNASAPALTAQYQYDLREIVAYTFPQSSATAIGGGNIAPLGLAPPNNHDLISLGNVGYPLVNAGLTTPSPVPPVPKAGPINPNTGTSGQNVNLPDGYSYFCNASIAPTNLTTTAYINYSAHPHAVDQFILISAGPDGIYGTSDDITSFGDVSQ